MRSLNKPLLDSSRTYSYSDSQVVSIFRFGVAAGVLMGGIVAAAILSFAS